MKVISAFIIITVFLVTGVTAAETLPIEKTKIINDVGAKLREDIRVIMTQYKGISQANAVIKEAGLSYQKALVADTANLSAYTTSKQQALMAGVYSFDATYAALFLKKKELAATLNARRTLGEKLGLGMALPPKLKKLVANPENINSFDECAEALDELLERLITEQMTTDQRMVILVDGIYGAVTEGMYVVTESIAQAGYPEEMLSLMDHQLVRINFMIRLLNVFRGEETFESAVVSEPRLKVLEKVKGLIEPEASPGAVAQGEKETPEMPPFFIEITQKEVDMIRDIVAPLRKNILNGNV